MDRRKKPLSYHISELRKRMLKIAIVFTTVACTSYFFAETLFGILAYPLLGIPQAQKLIFTELTEVFQTYVRLALGTGALVCVPLVFHELWAFILPGLKRRESHRLRPVFYISPLLFFAGISFAYLFVLPNAVKFFASFAGVLNINAVGLPLVLEARIADYFGLSLQILFAFGIAFQLPVFLYIAHWFGIVSVDNLRSLRRIALVVILVISAILTPPDVLSMLALAIPLYGLYEGTIFFLKRLPQRSRIKHA